jgi:glycosyltransferase involved in cell wall biosynthesis
LRVHGRQQDGLEDLISAFAMVVQTYPDLHLKLVGRTDFDGFDRLKSKVESLGLLSQIRFVGRVSNEEMVRILTGAKILVLARPMTEQAKGNFPTKLGEYLATGNPVLATRVGEVTKYLIDGQNAFLAEPSDPIDFAKKIHAIFQEYEHALKIGEKGRLLAQSVFNYKIQGRNLIGFFNTVI